MTQAGAAVVVMMAEGGDDECAEGDEGPMKCR